jgi:hypothetical protein
VTDWLFWHPDELRRVPTAGASTITFETKASWEVALLQGTAVVVGVLVTAVVTPFVLVWLFRRRLGWPSVVIVPIVLVTIAATVELLQGRTRRSAADDVPALR